MKQPLLAVAMVYGAGILLARFVALPVTALFVISFGLVALALSVSSQRKVLLWAALGMVGWTNLAWRQAILSPHDLRLAVGERAELVTVRGTLSKTPTLRVQERDEQETFRSLARVRVTELRRKTDWQPVWGEVLVSTAGSLVEPFFGGQRVEIYGVIRPPPTRLAEGLFDYRAYLRWQGIYYQLQVRGTNDWSVLAAEAAVSPPWADRFRKWAQATLEYGLHGEADRAEIELLWAMTLGWQTALTEEVSEPFMRSGTMHIFAISGLHIALIAGILVQLLRLVQVPRGWCGWLVIPMIWFYTGATGWQSSAVRSTIMMSVVIAGWALKRPRDLLNSLAAAGLIILIWEPRQLFQASFQLSFFVVLSIALLLPPFEKVRQQLLQTDPMLPAELRPRWQRWLDTPLRYVTLSFATSLAAWLGSLPLIAHYFHLVTPVSLLANLIMVPLSSLALMCNLGSLLCGSWLPLGTDLLNHSAWLWMRLMVGASEWAIELPLAFFYTRSPSEAEFVVYYVLLVGTLTGWLFAPPRRVWAGVGIAALAAVAWGRWWSDRDTLRFTVLPLDGGDAVFVHAAGRERELLVDCGNTNAVEFAVKPFLRAQGVNHLARLLLTHGDSRHIGGAGQVISNFSAGQVLTSAAASRSPAYRRLQAELEPTPRRWRRLKHGERIGPWTVLHPGPQDQFPQADDNAVVLRGEVHGASVLLLSDLGQAGQTALLNRELGLQADIVVTGLPNQSEPLGDEFLLAARPKVIVVSSADFPAFERPTEKLRARLARSGIPVFYTGETGAITVTLRSGGWEVRTMKGERLSRSAKR